MRSRTEVRKHSNRPNVVGNAFRLVIDTHDAGPRGQRWQAPLAVSAAFLEMVRADQITDSHTRRNPFRILRAARRPDANLDISGDQLGQKLSSERPEMRSGHRVDQAAVKVEAPHLRHGTPGKGVMR